MDGPGLFILIAGTYLKQHFFRSPADLDMLQQNLFEICEEFAFELQAWAIFSNHYHIVGYSPGPHIRQIAGKLHGRTSFELNSIHGTRGRKVWYRAWDTEITFEKSYLARLNYVHSNPVRHGQTSRPEDYPWCSAKWFQDHADRPFYETVRSFPIDTVNVYDDF